MHLTTVAASSVVDLLVGRTGAGGGSLMTLVLVALGVPVDTAISSDLVTRPGDGAVHGPARAGSSDLLRTDPVDPTVRSG